MPKPIHIAEQTLLDSIPEPVAITDAELIVLSVNKAFNELLGYSDTELSGRPVTSVSEACSRIAYLIKKGLRVKDLETSLTAKDGHAVPVVLSASFIHEADGFDGVLFSAKENCARPFSAPEKNDELAKRVEALEYFRDGVFLIIHDLEESERELEEAYKKLKATQAQLIQSSKLSALGELASSIVHEINQPLTVVKGLSQSLLKDNGSDAQMEKLRLIAEACRRMEQVVRHLRVFSRAETFDMQEVDLNAVIKDSFLILQELLSKSSIEIKTEFSELPSIKGSSNRLEQVVINLVTNARDAMAAGGTLTIKTVPVDIGGIRFARMSFMDTGCGIPEEMLGRIFDPFFTTKEPGKGTGLGLSISYGIIKEHNGDITVESVEGKGTAFHVTIPALSHIEIERQMC